MRFKHAIGVAMALALSFGSVPAHADYVVRSGDTTPVQMTFKSFISSLIHWPAHVVGGLFGGVPTAVNMTNTGALDVTVVATPTGASTSVNQVATQANPGSDATKAHAIQGVTGGKPVPVTGTFFQGTQPISASSLPLPTSAATSAAQTGVQETHGSNAGNTTYLRDQTGALINWSDFAPSGNTFLSAGVSSTFVALPNADGTIIVTNLGPSDAVIKLGTGSPSAALTDTYLPAGHWRALGVGSNTGLAGITLAGTANLKIVQGTGSSAGGGAGALVFSTATVGDVGTASVGGAGSACTTLTLPSGGGSYSSGQGVLNNATAGSVTNQTCQVSRYASGPVTLTGARLLSSNAAATGTFRVHFYVTAPTYSSGNGVALSTAHATHFCAIDVVLGPTSGGLVFSDGVDGFGVPVTGGGCTRVLTSGQIIYPVIEARSASTWLAAQTFIVFPQGFN